MDERPCKYCGFPAARQSDEDCPSNPANRQRRALDNACADALDALRNEDASPENRVLDARAILRRAVEG